MILIQSLIVVRFHCNDENICIESYSENHDKTSYPFNLFRLNEDRSINITSLPFELSIQIIDIYIY